MPRFQRLAIASVALAVGSTMVVVNPRSASPAVATTLPVVGVQFHGMWSSYDDTKRAQVLDLMVAAGMKSVRIDMAWRAFEETGKGAIATWYVNRADSIVNMARARNLEVLITLLDTPSWANGGQAKNVPPNEPQDYADFAGWLANHFKGKVSAYEVWNEPNLSGFWSTEDATSYAALVRAAYAAVKSSDPAAIVVAGVTSQNDTDWLARMYAAGVVGFYDVLSVHAYQGPANDAPEIPDTGQWWRMDHVKAVHELMVQYGDATKPIWATEFGWSTHDNTGITEPWLLGVTEAQQADYFARALSWFASRHPYVTRLFWYNERDRTNGTVQDQHYGLLRTDLTAKPAYAAIKAMLTGGPTSTSMSPGATPTSTTTATSSTTVAAPTTTTTVRPKKKYR